MPNGAPLQDLTFSRTDHIQVAGTQIACHRYGKGPAIIALHAIGHSARDFLKLAHAIGDRFEVIALDWPGQGDSPPAPITPDAHRYAQILSEAIATLNLQSYTLLGNSIGGAAAIIHASSHPQQVQSLVLCNSGGLQPVNFIARLYCHHMARFFRKGERGSMGFARKFRRYYERTVLPGSEATWRREEIITSGYDVAPVLRAAWQGFAAPQADIRALVAKLTMPVLYAWARDDQALAWSRSKKAALTAPDYEVSLFDGGHAAFLESPDRFQTRLTDFLGSAPDLLS